MTTATPPLPATHARRRLLQALGAACLPPLSTGPRAQAAVAPLRLGTSTPGGGFAQYGEVLARVLNAQAGRVLLQAVPTRGTAQNLEMMARGELDAALVQGTVAGEVLARIADGSASAAERALTVLHAMYPSPGLLAVPAASPARRLEDLRGRPVVWGVRASGLVTLARQVLAALDLDIDRDFEPLYVEQAAQSPGLVASGRAAGLWGAGEGWPGFEQIARSPGGARFLAPAPAQLPRILARWPLLQALDVPAGTYPGITAPLPTVGSVNLILAPDTLDGGRAAAFVQAMAAAGPALRAALPQAAYSTLARTRAAVASPRRLHPAVLRALTTGTR